MNIKSVFTNSVKQIEKALCENDSHSKVYELLNCIEDSWINIEKYSKTIDSKGTKYLNNIVKNIKLNERFISAYMIEDAKFYLKSINIFNKTIKELWFVYHKVIEGLLVYHEDECCNLCQGEFYYYSNEKTNLIMKKCDTCGQSFTITSDRLESAKNIDLEDFRPVKISEIVLINFEYDHFKNK